MYKENDRIFICGENRNAWYSMEGGGEKMFTGRYVSSENFFFLSSDERQ